MDKLKRGHKMRENVKEKDFERVIRGTEFAEIVSDIADSELLMVNFQEIEKAGLPDYKSMKRYFEECEAALKDPRDPANQQLFNDEFLARTGKRYLIGRYGEDRRNWLETSEIVRQGRFIHLGIDVFSRNLEPVYSPAEGEIVMTGFEPGNFSFGHYIVIRHEKNGSEWYSFCGHMSRELPQLGAVSKGDRVGTFGDFIGNENGGWTRHIHYQIFRQLPDSERLIGYSSRKDFPANKVLYPSPHNVLGLRNKTAVAPEDSWTSLP